MDDKKVLITGSSGGLARYFITNRVFNNIYSTTRNNRRYKNEMLLDLYNVDSFDYRALDSSWYILHMASISSPNKCIGNESEAFNINVTQTIKFIEGCIARGAKVLLFSTDNVYQGGNEVYTECSRTEPSSRYGDMKYLVESHFIDDVNFKAFRLSYVIYDKDKFTTYLKHCYENRIVAQVYKSFVRSVVAIDDLVDAAMHVINDWQNISCIVNIAGPEHLSRYDIAHYYSESVDTEVKVESVAPPTNFYDNRASTIKIESIYLQDLIGRPLTNINEYYIKINRK